MSAMNAIAAVPRPRYLLTFLCLAFLYSSIKLCREREISKRERPAVAETAFTSTLHKKV
jgi:hypothetical protein